MGLIDALNQQADETTRRFSVGVEEALEWLRAKYNTPTGEEATRRLEARKWLDLYECRGAAYFDQMIRDVFTEPEVYEPRIAMLPLAKYQNLTRRIVRDKSTVYSSPARRKVSDATNESYQELVTYLDLDVFMRERNRMENLHNQAFVYIRRELVRLPDTTEKVWAPALDLVTSDNFTAVAHPLRPTELLAIVLDRTPGGVNVTDDDPHFLIWTDAERIWLNKKWDLISSVPNEWGVIPGVLSHAAKPVNRLIDSDTNRDVIDANMAVVLLNVLLLYGQKEGTKAPYTTGDMSATVRGQVLDQTRMTEFGDDVTPGVLDLGHDPDALLRSARAVIAQLGANHGMPEEIVTRSANVNSGEQLELLLRGLKEIRLEQIPTSRSTERELAWKMPLVLRGLVDERFMYEFDGWGMNFGEVETPQDPLSRTRWRKENRSLGLRSAVDDIMDDDPDIDTRELAKVKLLLLQAENADLVMKQRALNMPSVTDATDPTASPEENGATGADDESDGESDDSAGEVPKQLQ